jgi:hypothetical protein
VGYTWAAVSIVDGQRIAELPFLECDTTSVELGRYTTTTAKLPLPNAPENWKAATRPGAAVLVQIDEATNVPVWGGMITRTPLDAGSEIEISLASFEAYFDRRYVGDLAYSQVGQNAIVNDLVNKFAKAGNGVNPGVPIRVEVVGGDTILRDRTYLDADNKSLYAVLTELSGVINGPEWTVYWESSPDQSKITPVLRVGDRIGNAVSPGLGPNAVFYIPGNSSAFSQDNDYSAAEGANDVMAYSTANGDEAPQSVHVQTSDPGRVVFEYRWTPSTSITDTDTLAEHAQKRAAQMIDGSNAIALSAPTSVAPRLGTDWNVGDDIGYEIRVPSFPGGLSGTTRAVGWELKTGDVDTVTPILLNPDDLEA